MELEQADSRSASRHHHHHHSPHLDEVMAAIGVPLKQRANAVQTMEAMAALSAEKAADRIANNVAVIFRDLKRDVDSIMERLAVLESPPCPELSRPDQQQSPLTKPLSSPPRSAAPPVNAGDVDFDNDSDPNASPPPAPRDDSRKDSKDEHERPKTHISTKDVEIEEIPMLPQLSQRARANLDKARPTSALLALNQKHIVPLKEEASGSAEEALPRAASLDGLTMDPQMTAISSMESTRSSNKGQVLRISQRHFFKEEFDTFIHLVAFMFGLHNDVGQPNLVHYLSELNFVAKLIFFFGGQATFRRPWVHRLYIWLFISSFVGCFTGCLVNMFFRMPPFQHYTITTATTYFHVFGFHAWIFWRTYVNERSVHEFTESFLVEYQDHSDNEDADKERGSRNVLLAPALHLLINILKITAFLIIIFQVLFVSWGYYVFALPPARYYQDNPHYYPLNNVVKVKGFAAFHAFFMWFAIPFHVSTVLCSIGLFLLMCRLHIIDVARILHVVKDTHIEICTVEHREATRDAHQRTVADHKSLKVDVASEIEVVCEAVEGCQHRLDQAGESLQWLWVHMVAYAYVVLTLGAFKLHGVTSSWKEMSDEEWESVVHTGWHAGVGLTIMVSVLVAPSGTTFYYQQIPYFVTYALRVRGWSIAEVSNYIDTLQLQCSGFRIFKTPVTGTMTSFFVSAMTAMTALLISFSGSDEEGGS